METRLPSDPRERLHGDNEDNIAGLVWRLERVHIVDVQSVVHADTRGITMIGGLDRGQLRRNRQQRRHRTGGKHEPSVPHKNPPDPGGVLRQLSRAVARKAFQHIRFERNTGTTMLFPERQSLDRIGE